MGVILGFPGKAASLLNQHRDEVGSEIAEKIAMALLKAGLYEKVRSWNLKLATLLINQ